LCVCLPVLRFASEVCLEIAGVQTSSSSLSIPVNVLSVAEDRASVENHVFPVRRMREMARLDREKRFALVSDPDQAEIVIFVESHLNDRPAGSYLHRLRKHPVFKAHQDKCYVHCGSDLPVVTVPGIYPSIENAWAWRDIVRSGCFLVKENPYLAEADNDAHVEYLASFVGCASSIAIRQSLMKLTDDRMQLIDNTSEFVGAIRNADDAKVKRLKRQYVSLARRSKFVLCPRGFGASSIRLFEAMQMGRAPVVISDHWVEPDGPDWESIIVRVRERDIERLPELLREREQDAELLGANARAAWEKYYAPETHFDHICQNILEIHRSASAVRRRVLVVAAQSSLLRPVHARPALWRIKNSIFGE
jgi:hypothetical protein